MDIEFPRNRFPSAPGIIRVPAAQSRRKKAAQLVTCEENPLTSGHLSRTAYGVATSVERSEGTNSVCNPAISRKKFP
jgi:hypothetical protein